MPGQPLVDLEAQIEVTNGVIDSAIVAFSGVQARIDAAIAEALANGATASELAPLTAVSADLGARTSALAAAVAANP